MKEIWDKVEKRKSLRTEAEVLVSSLSPADGVQPAEVLMHELLVHKIELEMQNEELRKAYSIIEEARDRYLDLYEFAPVGYAIISREALISEINLTGCTLLGDDRTNLISRRFSKFVAPQDRDHWHRLFLSLMEHAEVEKQAFELEMIRADGSTFYSHIDCRRLQVGDAPPMLRISLTDISKLKRAETELRIAAIAFESQQGMIVTDANTTILRVNRAFTAITGYTAHEAIGQTPRLLKSGRHHADFYSEMWDTLMRTGGWEGEIWNKRKNGEVYSEMLYVTAVKNDSGTVTHYIAAFSAKK